MITIQRSVNSDSRTADQNIEIKDLVLDTVKHQSDVNKAMSFIETLIDNAKITHDHTKTENMPQFYDAIKSGNVKNSDWYKMHITSERHHLLSNVPEDVNLVDVLEHVCDCVMAGLGRSGTVYDVEIPNEILQRAVKNTVELLKENTKVVEAK